MDSRERSERDRAVTEGTASERHADSREGPRTPILRNPFVWAFLIGIVMLTAIRPLLRRVPEPPPVFGELPAITLIGERGEPITKESLHGRVWIAAIIASPCEGTCRAAIAGMKRLQDALREREIDGIGLLSVVADSRADLTGLAREAGADPDRWTFAYGDASAIGALERNRQRASAPVGGAGGGSGEQTEPLEQTGSAEPTGSPAPTGSQGGVPRTEQGRSTGPPGEAGPSGPLPLLLIDGEGMMRGRYGVDDLGLDEIYNRAQHLMPAAPR